MESFKHIMLHAGVACINVLILDSERAQEVIGSKMMRFFSENAFWGSIKVL